MAPLNGRPPDRREKPSSATSVIDIGSNPRTSSYPRKLAKEKEKISRRTTLKIRNLRVNSYDDGRLRGPTEEREVAGASHDVKFYIREFSVSKPSRVQPQARSIESRPSTLIRNKTNSRKDDNDGLIAGLDGQVGPDTNNCRANEKMNEKISAWDHLSKISSQKVVSTRSSK